MEASSSELVDTHLVVNGWLQDIKSQLGRFPQDISVIKSLVEAAFSSGLVDDRKYASVFLASLSCAATVIAFKIVYFVLRVLT